MSGVDVQDLVTVVIGRKTKKATDSSEKKPTGVVGIGGRLESGTARKLDDNEAKAPETVGREVGKAIMAAREAKEWDQKALANSLNIAKGVVVQLEQGVHKKDNPLLQRFEKKLGIWLTGNSDRIGTPKAEKEKKKAVQKKTPTSSKVKPAKTENADSKVAAVENGPSIDETLTAATETGEQDDHKETEQVKT